MKNTTVLIAGMIGAAMLGLGISATGAADLSGEKLTGDRCTRCHTAERFVKAKKAAADWKVTVDRMVGKGAKLSAGERQSVLDYLSALSAKNELR